MISDEEDARIDRVFCVVCLFVSKVPCGFLWPYHLARMHDFSLARVQICVCAALHTVRAPVSFNCLFADAQSTVFCEMIYNARLLGRTCITSVSILARWPIADGGKESSLKFKKFVNVLQCAHK